MSELLNFISWKVRKIIYKIMNTRYILIQKTTLRKSVVYQYLEWNSLKSNSLEALTLMFCNKILISILLIVMIYELVQICYSHKQLWWNGIVFIKKFNTWKKKRK